LNGRKTAARRAMFRTADMEPPGDLAFD